MVCKRAAQIAYWLKGNPSPEALKDVCDELENLEFKGELAAFVSEEIDKDSLSIGRADAAIYDPPTNKLIR